MKSSPNRLSPRKWLSLVVSILLLVLVLMKVKPAVLAECLRRGHPAWWALGMALIGLACLFSALRWHLMLQLQKIETSLTDTLHASYMAQLWNLVFFGPAGGDVAKTLYFHQKYQAPLPDVMASCWMDRFVAGLSSVLFAAGLILAAEWSLLQPLLRGWRPGIQFYALAFLGFCVLAGLIIAARRMPNNFLSRCLSSFASGLKKMWATPGPFITAILLGVLVQCVLSSVMAFNLVGLTEKPIPFRQVFWIFPVISLLAALPISTAGAGVREGASLLLLTHYGIEPSAAVAASLLTFLGNLVWAAMGMMLWIRERRRW